MTQRQPQTRTCYVGARAPEPVLYTLVAYANSHVPDFADVTGAAFEVFAPGATTATAWTAEVVSQASGVLTLRHVFAADGSDVPAEGRYEFYPRLTTAAGTYPSGFDVLTVVRRPVGQGDAPLPPPGRIELGTVAPLTFTAPAAPVNTVAPVASGDVYPGETLSCTDGVWTGNPTPVLTYQWRRTDPATELTTAIEGATGADYDATEADLGYRITRLETATNWVGTASASSNALAYDYDQTAGLFYLIDNVAAVDTADPDAPVALTTITDRSPGARVLTTGGLAAGGVATTTPLGSPFHLEDRGAPALIFDASRSQYAQDQGAGAAAYAAPTGGEGIAWLWHGQLPLEAGVLFGTRANTSNNEPGWNVTYDLDRVTWQTATVAGVKVNASTPSDALRPGDTGTLLALAQSNGAYSLEWTREARDKNDPAPNAPAPSTGTVTGSYVTLIGTPPTPPAGLTLCARADHTAGYTSLATHVLLVCAIGPTTTADLAAAKAAVLNRCRPATTFLSDVYEAPLTYNGLATGETGGLHWPVLGQTKVAAQIVAAENAIVADVGYASPVHVEMHGDSRMLTTEGDIGPPVTPLVIGTNDMRTTVQAGARTWTRVPVGPLASAAGAYNAVSGYVVRSSAAQSGFSARSPGLRTDDTNYGASAAQNDTQLFVELLGINALTGSHEWDTLYEKYLRTVYRIEAIVAAGYASPSFVFVNEAVAGSTTTGVLQRAIRAFNRALEIMVGILRAKYPASRFVVINTNDLSYYH